MFFLTAIVFLSSVSFVSSHAILTSPSPRTGAVAQQFTGPAPSAICTSNPGVADSPIFEAGTSLTVSWTILATHSNAPGVSVSIQYSPGAPFFELAKELDVNDLSASVRLPLGRRGENAVLQFVWEADDGNYYLGCSDLQIFSDDPEADAAIDAADEALANETEEPVEDFIPPQSDQEETGDADNSDDTTDIVEDMSEETTVIVDDAPSDQSNETEDPTQPTQPPTPETPKCTNGLRRRSRLV
jgi:hypothetical protein